MDYIVNLLRIVAQDKILWNVFLLGLIISIKKLTEKVILFKISVDLDLK